MFVKHRAQIIVATIFIVIIIVVIVAVVVECGSKQMICHIQHYLSTIQFMVMIVHLEMLIPVYR